MTFATNLAAQFQRITEMHPQLLNAVPPAAIETRYGAFSLKVAEFWAEFCSREWQARAGRDENLIGPFRMYGECLAPFAQPGELHWYDPTLPAQDGDIVLVQWDPSVLLDMYERNSAKPEWLSQYGEPCPIATKVYKTVGPSQYLLTRKSALPLGTNKILGVLRKRLRDESCEAACSAGLIEPNAATDVGGIEVNSDSYNFPNPTGTQDRSFTAFTYTNAFGNDFEIEISVTGNRKVTTPVGLSGTTDVLAWVSVLNVTDSVLVASTQDYMVAQIDDQPANSARSFIESTVFVVTIPVGKTFQFTPKCRVFPVGGSTGNINLLTTAYSMRVTSVKR